MKKRIFSLLIALISALTFCISAGAFDANDYDYSSDWGSGSDWSSGSDWDWDDDNDYDYYYSGSTSSGSGGGGGIGFGTIVVIVIIVIVLVSKNKNNGSNNNNGGGAPTTGMGGGVRPANGGQGRNVNLPDRTGEIERIIKEADPNFTADDFTSFAKNVYIDIQNAWCKRDLSEVRPVMHTNLFNTTQKQVQSKIDQKVIYHYESIAINTAYLTSYVRDEQYEYLTVYLNARFIDYQTSEETGAIIRGDKNTRWDFRYKMKFMRSVGMLTKDANADNGYGSGHNCPNCGAPLEISSSGKCAYCDSVVTTGMYSWVLSDFTTVRDDTKDDGIRVPTKVNNAGGGQTIRILSCLEMLELRTQVAQVITGFTNLSLAEAEQVLNNLPQTITYRTTPKAVLDYESAKQVLVNMGVVIEGHTNVASGAKVALDLVFFPSTSKIQTIEVIRKHTGVGLKEAKDFTESMPCTIYEGTGDKANALKADLDALGVDSRIRKL